jgi:hypothetical protein
MELSPYVSALRDNLAAAAAAGDEQTRTAARVLAATIEPAARLAIMNALSDLAGEVTLALDNQVVEVRLDGQDVQVVVTRTADEEEPEHAQEPPQQPFDPNGDISRITVRLFEELKGKAEQAAAAQGVSLNSFVQQAVQGALGRAQSRGRGRGGWSGGTDWSQHWGNFGGGGFGRRTESESTGDQGDSGEKSEPAGSGKAPHDKPWNDEQQRRGSSRVRGWVEG